MIEMDPWWLRFTPSKSKYREKSSMKRSTSSSRRSIGVGAELMIVTSNGGGRMDIVKAEVVQNKVQLMISFESLERTFL
jgi:hypothetical protein